MYAGGKTANNKHYYLYNGQDYWTMSLDYWLASNSASIFCLHSNGYFDGTYVSNTSPGVRPVINLKADTQFQSGGNGTQNNPYVVK